MGDAGNHGLANQQRRGVRVAHVLEPHVHDSGGERGDGSGDHDPARHHRAHVVGALCNDQSRFGYIRRTALISPALRPFL